MWVKGVVSHPTWENIRQVPYNVKLHNIEKRITKDLTHVQYVRHCFPWIIVSDGLMRAKPVHLND